MNGVARRHVKWALLLTLALTNSCIPPAEIPALSSDELTLVISKLILLPEITCEDLRTSFDVEYLPLVDTPDELGLPYEEHWLPVGAGDSLRGWVLPTALDRGTVVLSQGSLGSMPCYLFHARLLVNNGWSVVMYEYRGLGNSSGTPSIAGLQEDLTTVVDWARDYLGREQVTLMGGSLGATPSVAVAVARPEAVNGVILDSPVAIGEFIERLEFALGDRTYEFIASLTPELLIEESIRQMYQPLLILLGSADIIATPASVQEVYERAPGPKQLVIFPGVSHAEEPFRDTGTYTFHVESFLSSIWAQREVLSVKVRAP